MITKKKDDGVCLCVQGEGEERREPPADALTERPVEGGLGGAVWSQALHQHHPGVPEPGAQAGVSHLH